MIAANKKEFLEQKALFYKKIKQGCLFIHPTDTIYGIGCDATNEKSVKKIRTAKNRPTNPFSVIVPSNAWIKDNCILTKEANKYLKKLPGPYTLILKLKKQAVAKEVNNNQNTIGVRMPNHWIKDIVKELNIPIVTTSANRAGETFMTDLDTLSPRIMLHIDFIIYEGKKHGRPSEIIDLTKKKPLKKKR